MVGACVIVVVVTSFSMLQAWIVATNTVDSVFFHDLQEGCWISHIAKHGLLVHKNDSPTVVHHHAPPHQRTLPFGRERVTGIARLQSLVRSAACEEGNKGGGAVHVVMMYLVS